MRNMPWNEDLWQKLKDAVSPMPPFVRRRALKTIIEASETFAQEREAEMVEEEDLVRAAKERVPAPSRGLMLGALAEMGIGVEVAERPSDEPTRRASGQGRD
jgi:hypothetical protein